MGNNLSINKGLADYSGGKLLPSAVLTKIVDHILGSKEGNIELSDLADECLCKRPDIENALVDLELAGVITRTQYQPWAEVNALSVESLRFNLKAHCGLFDQADKPAKSKKPKKAESDHRRHGEEVHEIAGESYKVIVAQGGEHNAETFLNIIRQGDSHILVNRQPFPGPEEAWNWVDDYLAPLKSDILAWAASLAPSFEDTSTENPTGKIQIVWLDEPTFGALANAIDLHRANLNGEADVWGGVAITDSHIHCLDHTREYLSSPVEPRYTWPGVKPAEPAATEDSTLKTQDSPLTLHTNGHSKAAHQMVNEPEKKKGRGRPKKEAKV